MALPSIHSSIVFCPPLPGKPDPNQTFDPSSGEIRSRVKQSAQKGNSCGYNALQLLRDERRIGKFPSASQIEERKIEKAHSLHRKRKIKIDAELKKE